MRKLLELGAEPNAFNPEGAHAHCTPASWARHLGYSEIETYLKGCR